MKKEDEQPSIAQPSEITQEVSLEEVEEEL